jgi:Rrf2 family cysteine metabolism transcriptional repressor
MKFSARSRYGIRALVQLAIHYKDGPLPIKTLAEREKISNKYLEQLAALLKNAGLISSIRGPNGGYVLAREPEEIKLTDVFAALEGTAAPFDCIVHKDFCSHCGDCVTKNIWLKLEKAMNGVLASISLKDVMDDNKATETSVGL